MVDMVCSNFENVIVIYNGANQFELGFADEYPQIKSVVWCREQEMWDLMHLVKYFQVKSILPEKHRIHLFMI